MQFKDQLTISEAEWAAAEKYFNDPQNIDSNKMSRPRVGQEGFGIIKHSFLKVDGVIYAMDNKESKNKNGKYLGEGTYGKVSVVQTQNGDNFALKVEVPCKDEYRNIDLAIMKLMDRLIGTAIRVGKGLLKFKRRAHREVPGKFYTVQKLLPGMDLFDQVTQTKLTFTQKLLIAAKALKEIDFLHRNNVVHGDIKLENFMSLVNDLDITLNIIDFGFSQLLTADQTSIRLPFLVGTISYHAPEITQSSEFSFATDRYALGVMFTKYFPLPLYYSKPEQKLQALINKMLDTDPTKRPYLTRVRAQLNAVLAKRKDYTVPASDQAENAQLRYDAALQERNAVTTELASHHKSGVITRSVNFMLAKGEEALKKQLKEIDVEIAAAKTALAEFSTSPQLDPELTASKSLVYKYEQETALQLNSLENKSLPAPTFDPSLKSNKL
jgi:serine/threonine protein kinase